MDVLPLLRHHFGNSARRSGDDSRNPSGKPCGLVRRVAAGELRRHRPARRGRSRRRAGHVRCGSAGQRSGRGRTQWRLCPRNVAGAGQAERRPQRRRPAGRHASAASVAGLLAAHAAGLVPPGARIVCTVTGHGLKDPSWALRDAGGGEVVPTRVSLDAFAAANALGLEG